MTVVALLSDVIWPIAIFLAWLLGECAFRFFHLPRISIYAVVGLAISLASTYWLKLENVPAVSLLANLAFGLILFECGYRFNAAWLRKNIWLTATSFFEAGATFLAVYSLLTYFGYSQVPSLMMASLCVASSPATIVRVVNEVRSSGQVTERIMHLSVLNCLLAVFAFKVVLGLFVYQTSGDLPAAALNSAFVLAVSLLLGWLVGVIMCRLLRGMQLGNPHPQNDATLAFTLAVIIVVGVAHSLKLSPVLAALTLGFVTRYQRVALTTSQRGFGALGDLLAILLFVFVAAQMQWQHVTSGIAIGLLIVVVRLLAKVGSISLLSRVSGVSLKKGALIGLASAPLSAFAILLIEQAKRSGIDLYEQLLPLASATLILEIVGPYLVLVALSLAKEIPRSGYPLDKEA